MEEKSNPQKPKIIVIIGPTSSGKSNLALQLAKLLQGKLFKNRGVNGAEIISADSRQVYRGMDIGTGKVTKAEQKMAKHYLLDVASPKKTFTASDYKKLGEKALKTILKKNKIPIITGGTGFYIDTLLGIINLPEVSPNPKLRQRLDKLSAEHLFKMLRKLDPQRAKTIDAKNKRRLIRAIEIITATGKPVPQLSTKRYELSTKYSPLWLGLTQPMVKLSKKIEKRLDERLQQGMIKEVQNLLKSGVSYRRLFNFGLEYRQISEYLASKKFKVESVKNFKESPYYQKLLREIIKYSKRQMTWFKRNKKIHWIKSPTEANSFTKKFLSS